MFNAFFDNHDSDGLIQSQDIAELLEKIRKYCGYEKTDEKYLEMEDILWAFFGCLVDQVSTETLKSSDAKGYDTVIKKYIFIFNFFKKKIIVKVLKIIGFVIH